MTRTRIQFQGMRGVSRLVQACGGHWETASSPPVAPQRPRSRSDRAPTEGCERSTRPPARTALWAGRPRERPTGRRGARPLRSASMSGAVAEAACPPVGLQSCSDRAAMPGSRFRAQKTSGVQSPAWTLQCGKHSSEPRLSGQFEADRALIRAAWCSKVPCGRCVGLNFPIVKPPVSLPSYGPCPVARGYIIIIDFFYK